MKIINNKTDKIEDVRLRVGIRMIEQGKAREIKEDIKDNAESFGDVGFKFDDEIKRVKPKRKRKKKNAKESLTKNDYDL